jgi:uncharacterized iron-regulated membrane protein
MTGTTGALMWIMMGLMIAAMGAGALTWAKRRLHRPTAQHPQPPTRRQQRPPSGPAGHDTPE